MPKYICILVNDSKNIDRKFCNFIFVKSERISESDPYVIILTKAANRIRVHIKGVESKTSTFHFDIK